MKAANDNRLFYTYIWRDGNGVPFYVGKGTDNRAQNVKARSREFKEVYALGGCFVEIVDYFMHESQVHANEVELIARYGRRDMGGLLVNKTDGGEGARGWQPSAETREKIGAASRGKKLSSDHRAAIGKSLLGNARRSGIPHAGEVRAKISQALFGMPKSYETRAKMSISALGNTKCVGRVLSDETRSKMSLAGRVAPPRDGFKGVSARRDKWITQVAINGKQQYIGTFSTPEEAARAYDAAVNRFWGPGPWYRNFPATAAATAAA